MTNKHKLWKQVSLYIRLKFADENGMTNCVCCGVRKHYKDIDCGHFIPKSKGMSIYFYERNLAPSCKSCNRFQGGNLSGYAIWLAKTYGAEIFEELETQRRKIVQYKELQYLALIQEYKNKIKKLIK